MAIISGKQRDKIIKEEYLVKGKTRDQVAKLLGLTLKGFITYLHRNKIRKFDKQYRNKSWIYKQYIDNKLSSSEIAEKCSCHKSLICTWLRKHHIPIRSSQERQQLANKSRKLYTEAELEELSIYRRAVWQITNINFQHYYWEINPNNLKRGSNYHLDHKYPIISGFKNKVLPSIIAVPANLQLLSAKDNRVKYRNPGIELQELYNAYNNFKQ